MDEGFNVGSLVLQWNDLDSGGCGSGGLVFSVFGRKGLLLAVLGSLGIHIDDLFCHSGLGRLENFRRRCQTLGILLLIARLSVGEATLHVDILAIDGSVHFKVVELNFVAGRCDKSGGAYEWDG